VVQLPAHRFYLAMLFQPQRSSRSEAANPAVMGFVRAAHAFRERAIPVRLGGGYSESISPVLAQQTPQKRAMPRDPRAGAGSESAAVGLGPGALQPGSFCAVRSRQAGEACVSEASRNSLSSRRISG